MNNLERREWILQARQQAAIVQQLEGQFVDPQEQAVRLQLARALKNG